MLLQLEHDPDGWRRCALAFLDAQCWKAELGQMAVPAPPAAPQRREPVSQVVPAASPVRAVGGWRSWRQNLATTLSIAASFLIALVVGMGLNGNRSGGSLHSPSAIVTTTMEKQPLPNIGTALPPAVQPSDLETVTFTAPQSSATYRVSAQRRDTLDQDLLKSIPSIISPEFQQALEQTGHHVEQQRKIVPVQMNDGRLLVLPVDDIQIHYVGRPSQ